MRIYFAIKRRGPAEAACMATTKGESGARPIAMGERLPETCSHKLAKAHHLKSEGNQEFKAGEYRAAMKKYHHSLMYTRGVVSTGDVSAIPGMEQVVKYVATEEEKKAANELSLVVSNNLAACFLKMEKWEKVLEYANKVLEGDPDNSKALFRRGSAHIHLNQPDEARQDLTRAHSLTPENKEVKKQLAVLEQKTRELEMKEQKLYSTMLGGQ